ncbi:MAG: hypothetical protein ABIT37_20500 [Luteolibacter sp.]
MAGLLLGTGTLLSAADFVAPAEGPVAFRRDKVPLDAETMGNLSRQLGSLAAGLDTTTAAGRRTAAQMLALATALDPSNTAARELIADLQNGSHHPKSDPAETDKFHAKIWQYIGWLETPEAGEQGKALSACLADVIAFSDPKNPRAEAIRTAGEHGAWAGWVPTVSEFEPKAEVQAATEVEKSTPKAPEILLTKAEVRTPIWQKAAKEAPNEPPKWMLSSAPLRMTAHKTTEETDDPSGFTVIVRAAPDGGSLQQLGNSIKNLLKKQHGKLPSGWNVVITSDELQKSALSGKRQSISGAAAVLASAAVTGQEPDATIIGVVDSQGAFKLSSGFWDQLDSLGKGNGGRLVLPAAAAEYLPSILALEKPQFFLDYEVVLASNFQELLDLSAKAPKEPIATVSAKFQEIRAKAGTQAVGQYVANSFIRRRLADLAQEAPYHFSARMLAIQGAGNRPTQVPRLVLVPELRRAVAPMAWMMVPLDPLKSSLDSAMVEKITQTFEICRSQVDRLDRYVSKEDRELYTRVKEMVAGIRTLERAARSRSGDRSGEQRPGESSAVIDAHAQLTGSYKGVSEALAETAGDADAVTVPTP